MNKEILTLEGVTRIKNFTDKKVIEANRFSQEIITDGEIIEKGEQIISPFADENKKYMEKISEVSKRGAYELIKHDYSIEKATYIIKIYYENLRYMDYFGEIKDVEVYMDDVNSKETLKKVRDILDYKVKMKKEKYYIDNELLNKVTEEPVKFIRERANQ